MCLEDHGVRDSMVMDAIAYLAPALTLTVGAWFYAGDRWRWWCGGAALTAFGALPMLLVMGDGPILAIGVWSVGALLAFILAVIVLFQASRGGWRWAFSALLLALTWCVYLEAVGDGSSWLPKYVGLAAYLMAGCALASFIRHRFAGSRRWLAGSFALSAFFAASLFELEKGRLAFSFDPALLALWQSWWDAPFCAPGLAGRCRVSELDALLSVLAQWPLWGALWWGATRMAPKQAS